MSRAAANRNNTTFRDDGQRSRAIRPHGLISGLVLSFVLAVPAIAQENKSLADPAHGKGPTSVAYAVPAFDPAALPSLASIDAQTDIKIFLHPGVPDEMRIPALRRAWSVNPAIRNFKGLAELDWDFTAANSAYGF